MTPTTKFYKHFKNQTNNNDKTTQTNLPKTTNQGIFDMTIKRHKIQATNAKL